MTKPRAPDTIPQLSSPSLTPTGATHTWEGLAQLVPAPTPAQLAMFAIHTPPAALIERGSHIRSEKIRTDMVRLCGIAADFYPTATPAQRRLLLGFSSALLGVTVYAGIKLGDMLEQRDSTVGHREGNLAADTTTAATIYDQGMAERESLATALDTVVKGHPTLETRVSSAHSRVTDHPSLTTSLLALAKVGHDLLSDKASLPGQQLAEGGLTLAELDEVTALAARVKSSGAVAGGARVQGPVSPAALNHQDGICLEYLERVMKVFNGAHERDPAIPQLLPIATRSIFAPTTRKQAAAPPADASPAEPPADPAAATGKKPA